MGCGASSSSTETRARAVVLKEMASAIRDVIDTAADNTTTVKDMHQYLRWYWLERASPTIGVELLNIGRHLLASDDRKDEFTYHVEYLGVLETNRVVAVMAQGRAGSPSSDSSRSLASSSSPTSFSTTGYQQWRQMLQFKEAAAPTLPCPWLWRLPPCFFRCRHRPSFPLLRQTRPAARLPNDGSL
jgi:hypothetical protein